jgi:hypothetical protein
MLRIAEEIIIIFFRALQSSAMQGIPKGIMPFGGFLRRSLKQGF